MTCVIGLHPRRGHALIGRSHRGRRRRCPARRRSATRSRPLAHASSAAPRRVRWPWSMSSGPQRSRRENSQRATGSAASGLKGLVCTMRPNSVAMMAVASRAPPMSPIRGMTRGTRADWYIKVSSNSALMVGERLYPIRNLQLQVATSDLPVVTRWPHLLRWLRSVARSRANGGSQRRCGSCRLQGCEWRQSQAPCLRSAA